MLLPLLVGVSTFAVVAYLVERRGVASVEQRVAAYVLPRYVTAPTPEEQVMLPWYERTLLLTERQLEKLPAWSRYVALAERADMPIRPVVLFWAFAAGAALALLALPAFGLSIVSTATVVFLGVVAIRVWLRLRVSRRRRAFEEQLPELLMALSGALRAGHGLTQALQSVAADAPEPVSTEFGRVLTEARLGRSLEDALGDLGTRIGSRELDFVLDAILVQRQVGGSLAGIFSIVGESVRQRQQFALKIRSLTAMGRLSASTLLALPLGLAGLLSLMNHGYLAPLWQSGIGRMMIVGSCVLLAIGVVWLRNIIGYRG
jgi:tight adherence protein B